MKKTALATILWLTTLCLCAQTAYREISQNHCLAGSNCLAYPAPEGKLTPAPCGKRPFHISHYGRHGSRFLINEGDYLAPLATLGRADSLGRLTPAGKDALRKVRMMAAESRGRCGELTEKGARQHREIAARMYARFPEVFADSASVEAKSTVVIRCILSMENCLQELLRKNPKLKIRHDASLHDMYYMNFQDTALTAKRDNEATKAFLDAWSKRNINPMRVMARLFNDADYVRENVRSRDLYTQLFSLANILQDSSLGDTVSLYGLFDNDDLYTLWAQHNIGWFCQFGSSELNGGTQPFTQRNLLGRIILEADSCLALDKPGATLRFGHETMVLPLVCLLDINGYGKTLHPSRLEENQWLNYRIFPMGCNVQFIFYRKDPTDQDVWVKVLLNEEEATLPIQAVSGPYYRWRDVREHYTGKINSYSAESATQ